MRLISRLTPVRSKSVLFASFISIDRKWLYGNWRAIEKVTGAGNCKLLQLKRIDYCERNTLFEITNHRGLVKKSKLID